MIHENQFGQPRVSVGILIRSFHDPVGFVTRLKANQIKKDIPFEFKEMIHLTETVRPSDG